MTDDRRGEWNDQYVADADDEAIENDLDAFSFFALALTGEGVEVVPLDEEVEDWGDWEEWWDDDHGESLDSGYDED